MTKKMKPAELVDELPLDIFIYASDNCPRCEVLKTKLTNKGLKFHVISDLTNEIKDGLLDNGFTMLPVVSFDGELMDFAKANTYIESM